MQENMKGLHMGEEKMARNENRVESKGAKKRAWGGGGCSEGRKVAFPQRFALSWAGCQTLQRAGVWVITVCGKAGA